MDSDEQQDPVPTSKSKSKQPARASRGRETAVSKSKGKGKGKENGIPESNYRRLQVLHLLLKRRHLSRVFRFIKENSLLRK